MKKLFCGGRFYFDYQLPDYQEKAANDYRAILLGGPEHLLRKSDGIQLHEGLEYIGPFYFESDGMLDKDIVRCEISMIERCTDALFLLDGADCPGTICELTMAGALGKDVHIFYIRRPDGEETESSLHSPCWYAIVHSCLLNVHTCVQ